MIDEYKCWNTFEPVCPYCGHVEEDWYDWHLTDQNEEIVKCKDCGKEFNVLLESVPKFFTSVVDD